MPGSPANQAGPLHQLDPTGRFSSRAADYVKARPSYPSAAIDAILEGLGDPARLHAADIGAGTGISSRLLAQRGVRVLAIEPNDAMRLAAEPHPLVEWRAGTAESTGLADASVNLVLCAQAFHWFRPEEALAEFARVLQRGGRVALMWNDRDERDPFTRGYSESIDRHATIPAIARKRLESAALLDSPLFANARRLAFPFQQDLDEDTLITRATSASYAPTAPEPLAKMTAELRALHRAHANAGGTARLVYETSVYLAERP